MKKFVLLCLIFPCIAVSSNEITEDYFDIATNYSTYGKYSDATNYLDKILQIEPLNNEAKELKNTILRVTNPSSQSYLSTKNQSIKTANTYKKKGDISQAISTLISASNEYWAAYSLAELYRDNEDYNNALTYYAKAESINANYPQTYIGKANVYYCMKDYQNALKNINKYLTYNKSSDIGYTLRAKINVNLNNINDAELDIKKAISVDTNLSYLLLEAKILYLKGDYKTARDKLNIISANIQTSEVYKYIGLCDYAMGNYTSALLNLDKAIILSDDDKTINSKYNEIKLMLDKQK